MSNTSSGDRAPTHNILEIGAGHYYMGDKPDSIKWTSVAANRVFQPHEAYTGIDLSQHRDTGPQGDEKLLANWRHLIASRPQENIDFKIADARNLPFPDSSFHEVIARNVFSIGSGASIEDFTGIYKEASRVLTPDGKIVIYDRYTPYFYIGTPKDLLESEKLPIPDIEAVSPLDDWKRYLSIGEKYGLDVNKRNPRDRLAKRQELLETPFEELSDDDRDLLEGGASMESAIRGLRSETIWLLSKAASNAETFSKPVGLVRKLSGVVNRLMRKSKG